MLMISISRLDRLGSLIVDLNKTEDRLELDSSDACCEGFVNRSREAAPFWSLMRLLCAI